MTLITTMTRIETTLDSNDRPNSNSGGEESVQVIFETGTDG